MLYLTKARSCRSAHRACALSTALSRRYGCHSRDLQQLFPWRMLYADDVMLVDDDRNELEGRSQAWCGRLERFGLKLDVKKTEYLTTEVMRSAIASDSALVASDGSRTGNDVFTFSLS